MNRRFNRRSVLATALTAAAAPLAGTSVTHAAETTATVDLPLIGPVDDHRVHAMAFNLRVGVDSGEQAWRARLPRIVTLLSAEQPTILGTQEGLIDQIDDIIGELPDYGCVKLGREADGTGETCAVFYRNDRLEELDSGHLWLSDTPEVPGSIDWGATLPRMFTWVEFADLETGEPFIHINTHFDHRSTESRRNSALLIRDWAQNAQLPCIITGDFNSGPAGEPHEILAADGRHDTWDTADELLTPEYKTFNGWDPVPTEDGDRIDWVLGTEHFSVDKAAVNTWSPDDGNVPSDHWPVQALLAL